MKSIFRVVTFLSLLAVGGFAFVSKPVDAGIGSAVSASDLASAYGTHCARCHGANGHADTAKGRELDAADLTTSKVQNMSAAKMTRIIKNGKGDMPGFPKLSAAQITAIIRTVKSF